MQRLPSRGNTSRPRGLQTSNSFTRYEPSSSSPTTRVRASTVHESPLSSSPPTAFKFDPPVTNYADENNDIFESQTDDVVSDSAEASLSGAFSNGFDDLPIEIQALMESFLESLGAKVHPMPLSVDRLSELFQDFYQHANAQIASHITVLASRFPSEQSRTPSVSSAGSTPAKPGVKKIVKSSVKSNQRQDSLSNDQQMLTPSEIADRRKARRQLDIKRITLEEAVERGICEKVYSRIWRHRSTDDEERDEKLRSRAAALALVGVDLHELLSTALTDEHASTQDLSKAKEEDGDSARARLASARRSLELMNEEKYPVGKLNHLTAAHKSIVETLQQMMPSTSSADEVLPALIYSIITSDPNTNHVVSNFNFIQRFRASEKIDGEAAYCLTNLEAAITFLETVDLSSIRSDEMPEGPGRVFSQPPTPRTDTPDPMYHALPSHSGSSSPEDPKPLKERVNSAPLSSIQPLRPHRLSVLAQNRPKPFEAQSDAVLKAADEAFDTIHSALDGSFKFLFGRLRERQASVSPNVDSELAAPKTLEDARKLVSSPAPTDDDASVGDSSLAEQAEDSIADPLSAGKLEEHTSSNRVLKMIGGRRQRAPSLDSGQSIDSGGRKVSFAEKSPTLDIPKAKQLNGPEASKQVPPTVTSLASASAAAVPAAALGAVESMRNLGNTLNPLNPLRSFAGMGMMRGFSRTASSPVGTPSSTSANLPSPLEQAGAAEREKDRDVGKEKERLDLNGVAPPLQRFVECRDARDLNGYEVELLVRDYQRLAGVLRALREG